MSVYASSRARTEVMDWWTVVDNLLEEMIPVIGDEPAAREAADTILQGNIDTEASTRASADTTLQGNIDAEAGTRASADTTLQGNIDIEASTRASADATLQGNIDSEAGARAAADTALQTQITAVKGTADAAEAAITVLNGTGAGSVSKAVADGIAGVIAEAPASFDTLKEISDWISTHESDASAMNSAIHANRDNVAPVFSESVSYAVGQYVTYSGDLYRCTTAHSAGAWAAADFTQVTVGAELNRQKETLDTALSADATLQGNIDSEAGARAAADAALQTQITAVKATADAAEAAISVLNPKASVIDPISVSAIASGISTVDWSSCTALVNYIREHSSAPSTLVVNASTTVYTLMLTASTEATKGEEWIFKYKGLGINDTGGNPFILTAILTYLYTPNMLTASCKCAEVALQSVVNTLDSAIATNTTDIATASSNFAPVFSTTTSYAVGEYVRYNGVLYRCTTAHSAGAWVAGHFTQVTVGADIYVPWTGINVRARGIAVSTSITTDITLDSSVTFPAGLYWAEAQLMAVDCSWLTDDNSNCYLDLLEFPFDLLSGLDYVQSWFKSGTTFTSKNLIRIPTQITVASGTKIGFLRDVNVQSGESCEFYLTMTFTRLSTH